MVDWDKVSAIFLEALLTGIISGIVVYVTFRLGKRQADLEWQREIAQREEEQAERIQEDKILRRIETLGEIYDLYPVFLTNAETGKRFERQGAYNAQAKIYKAMPLFKDNEYRKTYLRLEELFEFTHQEPSALRRSRIDRLEEIYEIFNDLNTQLEDLELLIQE
jgi:hypothetical protein